MMRMARKPVPASITLMLLAVTLMAPAGRSMAQTPSTPSAGAVAPLPPAPQPATTDQVKQVEGTIDKVTGDRVTLANGTELTIPPSGSAYRGDLKPGESVKAGYQEKGGQKIVTFLQVEPTHQFGAPDSIHGCC